MLLHRQGRLARGRVSSRVARSRMTATPLPCDDVTPRKRQASLQAMGRPVLQRRWQRRLPGRRGRQEVRRG